MRVAELEDKLSKIHITEDEMKAFQKVSGLLGTAAPAAAPCIASHAADPCIAAQAPAAACIASEGLSVASGCWTECWAPIRQCIRQCWIFQVGGLRSGGGGFSGGGFGSLGG
jgi:hypothetical protein